MLILDSVVTNVTIGLLMPRPKSRLTSQAVPGGMSSSPRPGALQQCSFPASLTPPSPCTDVFQNMFAS